MAGRYAHETIHLGADGIVRPGELVPEQFTIATIFDRLAGVGDLFRGVLQHRQDLHPLLQQLAG